MMGLTRFSSHSRIKASISAELQQMMRATRGKGEPSKDSSSTPYNVVVSFWF
jgi:hypothetical protein